MFQLMPPLSPDEYAALEASIAARGVQVPVIVDEHGAVIDGHHRKRIAESLGIDLPTLTRTGLTDAEKRTLALSLNIDRRHLGREERRELVAASLTSDPQLADREHARRTGVSHPTVATVRSELESAGRLESFTSRISGDGRERPAANPPRTPAAATDVEADQASTESWPADDDDAALTQSECEALDSDWGDPSYDNLDDLVGETYDEPAAPEPERITGTDGKSYPKPAPRAPSRRPLTDDATRALDEVWAKTGKLAAVTADDRFRANRQAITDREGPKVLAALRELAAFAAAIKTGITPETEQARDNWAASLSDVIEVLTDLNNQSPQEET